MKLDQLEGKWDELKGKVKEKWGKLTDDDILAIKGKKDQLLGKLRQRYNYTADEATREVADLMQSCGCATVNSSKMKNSSCC